MNKPLKIFLIFIAAIFSIFVMFRLVVFFFLHDKAVHQVQLAINQNLESRVTIGDLSLSFLAHFPNVTIEIDSIAIVEQSYPILQAAYIELELNLFDLIENKLLFEKVEVRSAQFFAPIDSTGKKFMIRGKKKSETAAKPFDLEIPEIILKDITILVDNQFKGNRVKIVLDQGNFELRSYPDMIQLHGNAWGRIDTMKSKGKVGLTNTPLAAIDATMRFNTLDNKKIFDGTLQLADAVLQANGVLTRAGNGNLLDITLQTKEGNLDDILSIIPQLRPLKMKQLNPDACISLLIRNTGFVDPVSYPNLSIDFEISDAIYKGEGLDYPIEGVNLIGHLTINKSRNATKDLLVIETATARMNESFLEISGKIENFDDPIVDVKVNTEIMLDDLFPMPQFPNIGDASGCIKLALLLNGKFSDLETNTRSRNDSFTGLLELSDVKIEMNQPAIRLSNLRGEIRLSNEKISLEHFEGTYNDARFEINGKLGNFLPLVNMKDHGLATGSLDIYVDNLDISATAKTKNSEPDTSAFTFPTVLERLKLELVFNTSVLAYAGQTFDEFGVVLNLEKDAIAIKKTKFVYDHGTVNLVGAAWKNDQTPLGIELWATVDFDFLDLDKYINRHTGDSQKTNNMGVPDFKLHTDIRVGELLYKDHRFNEVFINAEYTPDRLEVARLDLRFPYGQIKTDFLWQNSDSVKWLTGGIQLDLKPLEMDSLKAYFLGFGSTSPTPKDSLPPPLYDSIGLTLAIKAREINHKGFSIKKLKGGLLVQNETIVLENLGLEMFDGHIAMTGHLDIRGDQRTLTASVSGTDLDFGTLVSQFNDTTTNIFPKENFHGQMGINGFMILNYNEELKHQSKDMIGRLILNLKDVKIKDFAPIRESLKFIKKESREEIYLTNQKIELLFHKDEMIIPPTIFQSSISNIEFLGYHSLEYDFGFNMQISVSDLLFKSRNQKIKSVHSDKKARVKGLKYYISARHQEDGMQIQSIKKKKYRSDLELLDRRYQQVDSALSVAIRRLGGK